MRSLVSVFVITAACLALAGPAAAADRYASPSGTGPAATCPQDDPCDVLTATSDANTVDGDNVILAPGHYVVASSILITDAVNMRGTGVAADTVIDSSANSNYPVFIQNPAAVISNLEIDASGNWPALFLVAGSADHLIVRGSAYTACSGGNSTFSEVLCASSADSGHGFAMSWGGSTQNMKFRNSTFVGGASAYGIWINNGTNATSSIDLMSVIATGGSGDIALQAGCAGCTTTMTADHSNFAAPFIGGTGSVTSTAAGSGTNVAAPPLFKDAAAGDYSELATSPTVDAGATNVDSTATDLAGLARVAGAAADIGAYEFVPQPPPPPPTTDNKDVKAPVVAILKKPKAKVRTRKIRVKFSADEPATFECRLNKGIWKPCRDSYRKTLKKKGSYRLQIRATDAAGNVSKIVTIRWKFKPAAS